MLKPFQRPLVGEEQEIEEGISWRSNMLLAHDATISPLVLSQYSTTTIGNMLDSTFEGTKWSSQGNAKGEIVVLFEGKITQKMHNSKRNKLLQGFAEEGDNMLVTASNMARVLKDVWGKWIGPGDIEKLLEECIDKYHPFTDYSATDDELKGLEHTSENSGTNSSVYT